MKTILIIGALAFTGYAVHAQADTTKNKTTVSTKGSVQVEKSYPTENMMEVNLASLPPGLEKTLSEKQYEGWKNGHLYIDKKTKEYALLLPPAYKEETTMKYSNDINSRKTPVHNGWYFFTAEGQPISN